MGTIKSEAPTRASRDVLTCPSSDSAHGNLLIGIVRADGSVAPIHPPLGIDDDFVRKAGEASQLPPEARFRLAGPCLTTSCRQWTGTRCAVGDAVADASPSRPERLPACAIRSTCRWWSQNGPAACRSCALVVHTPPGVCDPNIADDRPDGLEDHYAED
jgi:hypothetical protein